MKGLIDVVGAVIIRDGLVFCVKRGPHGSLPGLWEFPGGKIEEGEDASTALAREIEEKTLCQIDVGAKIATTVYEYTFGTVRLTTYYCQLIDDPPSLTEHVSEHWLRPEQLSGLDWAPADIEAVELVMTEAG